MWRLILSYKIISPYLRTSSADKTGRKPVQTTGARRSGRGPGPDYVAYVVFLGAIIICRVSKLHLPDQVQVTLHMKVSLSNLLQRCFVGPSLLGRGCWTIFFFSPGPEPALGGPAYVIPFRFSYHSRTLAPPVTSPVSLIISICPSYNHSSPPPSPLYHLYSKTVEVNTVKMFYIYKKYEVCVRFTEYVHRGHLAMLPHVRQYVRHFTHTLYDCKKHCKQINITWLLCVELT